MRREADFSSDDWDIDGESDLYVSSMSDFLETPAGDFDWGPGTKRLPRLRALVRRVRDHLPAIAIGAGFTLLVVGLVLVAASR